MVASRSSLFLGKNDTGLREGNKRHERLNIPNTTIKEHKAYVKYLSISDDAFNKEDLEEVYKIGMNECLRSLVTKKVYLIMHLKRSGSEEDKACALSISEVGTQLTSSPWMRSWQGAYQVQNK